MAPPEKEVDIQGAARHGDDNLKGDLAEETVPRPESIANMSDAEIQAMETSMVRKMDMVIMCVVILSLLRGRAFYLTVLNV